MDTFVNAVCQPICPFGDVKGLLYSTQVPTVQHGRIWFTEYVALRGGTLTGDRMPCLVVKDGTTGPTQRR